MTFAADAAAIFDGPLGLDAVYTPSGGGSVQIRVIPDLGDAASDFGPGRIVSPAATFTILCADVAKPVAGDALVVGPDSFIVQGEPVREDRRIYWRVEARPA